MKKLLFFLLVATLPRSLMAMEIFCSSVAVHKGDTLHIWNKVTDPILNKGVIIIEDGGNIDAKVNNDSGCIYLRPGGLANLIEDCRGEFLISKGAFLKTSANLMPILLINKGILIVKKDLYCDPLSTINTNIVIVDGRCNINNLGPHWYIKTL